MDHEPPSGFLYYPDVLSEPEEAELAAFRLSMSRDAFEAACRAAADHLMRERLALPTVAFR